MKRFIIISVVLIIVASFTTAYIIAPASGKDNFIQAEHVSHSEGVKISVKQNEKRVATYVAANKDGGKLNMYEYILPETDGAIYEMKPNMGRSDFSAILSKLQPGDMVVFHAGEYDGVCAQTTQSGTAGKPIIFTVYGDGQVKLMNTDTGTNLWEIKGSHIVINGFEFSTTTNNAIIRIMGSDSGKKSENITIANCYFSGSYNTNINANNSGMNINGIYLYNNYITGLNYTPLYFGEQDGNTVITNFVMDGNFIDGTNMVVEGTSYVGYGIELKKNVVGAIIRNNYFVGTKGPGIMVYGADDQTLINANIVENNFVTGVRNSQGINIGAGPSVAKGNIVVAGANSGIYIQNYHNWNIMNNIQVTDNITINNKIDGINALNMLTTANGAVLAGNIVVKAENQNGISVSENPGYAGWEGKNTIFDNELGYNEFTQMLSTRIPSTPELNQIAPLLKKSLGLQEKVDQIFIILGK